MLSTFLKMLALLALITITISCAGKRNPSISLPGPTNTIPLSQLDLPEAHDGDLMIAATTDFHAALERAEGLASIVNLLKKKYGGQLLYLDGGDLFQGTLEGNLNKGQSIVEFFNAIGLDAAAIGNHDLDYGPDAPGRFTVLPNEDGLGNLKRREQEAKFHWMSANFVLADGKKCVLKPGNPNPRCNALGEPTIFAPHAIFRRSGHKVCVIGATIPATVAITRPDFVKGTRFSDLKPVIEAEAKFLRKQEKCEFIVLTAHAGLQCDGKNHCRLPGDRADAFNLANAIAPGTLDAFVAGHTHQLGQEVINGTPILEAGALGAQVGLMRLAARNGQRQVHFESFIPVPENAEVPEITSLLEPYREAARERKTRPAGGTMAAFIRAYREENALNNLIADSLLEAGRAVDSVDCALNNAGSLRSDLPEGPLSYGDVFKVQPFDNSLAIVELKGSELRRIIEIALSGGHGVGGVSGLKIKRLDVPPGNRGPWDRDLNNDGLREDWERNLIVEILDEKNQPIENNRRYKIATSDFLVAGGDHETIVYKTIPDSRKRIFGDVWIRDILVEYLKKHPGIDPKDYFSPDRPRVQNTTPNH